MNAGARWVLIVDDEPRFRDLYARTLHDAGFETRDADSAEAALARLDRGERPAMIVTDVRMPGADGIELLRCAREVDGCGATPFLLVTAYPDVADAVSALKLGAVDYLQKPVDLDELLAAVRDALGVRVDDGDDGEPLTPEQLGPLTIASPTMRALARDALRVAVSDASILLTGESGAGKGMLADFIHRNSARTKGSLVAVNCASIPAHLIASEMFGHEKGAFTGASAKRRGFAREADGGTLFLDEIGDMPLDLQPALLRVLETKRVTPLGSDTEVPADFRLVAATNQDLLALVEQGRFRRDLYYRLNVIALDIPPLRERAADILPLAEHFLDAHGERKRLSRAAARLLEAYAWPGNVRELANAMERARLLARTEVVLPEHLPPSIAQSGAPALAAPMAESGTGDAPAIASTGTLEDVEVETIRRVLAEHDGNRTRAAAALGISRRGLINKIKRYEL